MIDQLIIYAPRLVSLLAKTGEECQTQSKITFLGLKAWYYYLPLDSTCGLDSSKIDLSKNPGELWVVGAVIFEDLVRISALIAIGFVIAGGYRMMISQGEPQAFAAGRKTVINALIGLAIAVIASQLVAYLAGRFT